MNAPKKVSTDQDTSISELKKAMDDFVKARKWGKFHTPKELAMALSIESAELMEIFLFQDRSIDAIKSNDEMMSKIADEAADVLAYLLSFCNSIDLDLTAAFFNKLEKTKKKYPRERFQGWYEKQ